jgi:hypothetical protein
MMACNAANAGLCVGQARTVAGFSHPPSESLTLHRFGKQSLRAEYWDPAAARKAIGRLKFKVPDLGAFPSASA